MSVPSNIRSGVGFRNATIFALNTAGTPAASGPTAYQGLTITGNKVLTINDPEPRRIPHIGDDGVFALDVLPPTESMTGELRTGKINDPVDAIMTGQKAFVVGEANLFGMATNKRGFEAQLGFLAYRQAQDTDPDSPTYGKRLWDFRLSPRCIFFPREQGYSDAAEERIYTMTPMYVTAHLWGTQFEEGTEGYVRSQLLRGVSEFKPKIVAYKGDGIVTAIPLPTSAPAVSAGKVVCWRDGVLETPSSVTTTTITLTTLLAADEYLTVFYETN